MGSGRERELMRPVVSGSISVASNWANISGTSEATNADKTIVGGGMLLVSLSSFSSTGGAAPTWNVYVNGSLAASVTAAASAHVGVRVRDGDTVHFGAVKGTAGSGTSASWTVTTNAHASTFTVAVDAPP